MRQIIVSFFLFIIGVRYVLYIDIILEKKGIVMFINKYLKVMTIPLLSAM